MRLGVTCHFLDLAEISIHAPTWGATWWFDTEEAARKFQSTHPRGVRRHIRRRPRPLDGISIHAPTWGATAPSSSSPPVLFYFNPRTHVGCDLESCRGHFQDFRNFNPRTHVGCDVRHLGFARPRLHISIHAPTWGATEGANMGNKYSEFQSTHPRGVRRVLSYQREALGLFQSTHPRGVRPTTTNGRLASSTFQSTHPRGVRQEHDRRAGRDAEISIHAPTWGATPWQVLDIPTTAHFNPRTHVGCDGLFSRSSGDTRQFQSTHPRGVRPLTATDNLAELKFQSTHPRGVRLSKDGQDGRIFEFQSTHPRGVRHKDKYRHYDKTDFNPRTHVGCDKRLQP